MPNRSFDNIYTDYSRLVYWAAYRVVSHTETAEDITQQVFERVYLNLEKLSTLSDAQLKSWLYRVSTNLALDHVRKAKHELLSDEPLGAEVPDGDPLPEAELLEKKRNIAVRKAIEQLDEANRTVINLHYFSGMTVSEISEATGISQGTIKSRLVRARKLLSEMLKAEAMDYEE